MRIVVVIYEGEGKISALKAVRNVFGNSIKEAKELVENKYGFFVTEPIWRALNVELETGSLDVTRISRFVTITNPHTSNPMGLSSSVMQNNRC